jgi:plastocyanin
MYTLDSRFIRLGNCFAYRFSVPGTFAYALSPIASSLAAHHGEPPAQAVIVTEGHGADQRQHYVKVSLADKTLTARPAELRVTAGDLVVWSADQSVTFGFRVRGRIGDEVIDSASLRTESIFTHAFRLPGSYEWADANGSGLHGQVRVSMPAAEVAHEEWLDRLQQGTLVHVRGDRAEPEMVDIVAGQTVVWAVEDAPGVSITDTSLIAAAPGRLQTG